MFKKIVLIVVPIIAVIALIFFFGINSYNSKYTSFQADGHIIAKNSKSTTEKVFFDTDTKYKTIDDNVYLETKGNDSVSIPKESFIHYTDGSISTFSKTVVLDLDGLDTDLYKYYNIFAETIFVRNGSNYSVNYLDNKLNFSNFLLKINDEKYMIIGPKLKLKIGDVEKIIEYSYLEVSYLDGNVIKIENQSVAYQSVDDSVLVEVGDGVIIDLSLKNIYKDKERKISLGEITIDSDDNIEINAEDNKSITGEKISDSEEKTDDNTKGNGSKGNGSSGKENKKPQLPEVNSGVVDTTTNDLEQIVDENARIKDAEFKVIDLDVTANRLRSTIQITDDDAVLDGDINIKIVEYDTNKIVFETNDDSGSNIIEVENEILKPETNYILVLNSDYKKNNVLYNKDFVQKTFVTSAIGVSLDKYFVSDNELQLNVKKSTYSDVISVDLQLLDLSDKVLKTITVPLSDVDNIVSFDGLTNNTTYRVKMYNYIYKDAVIADGFSITKDYITLKRKPSIGTTSFTIDKKEAKFNLMISNMIDSDSGVTSYKYEIYDARTVGDPNATPINVIEKGKNTSISVDVDGVNFERGVPYVFRVAINFNDNEKDYEYYTEFSDVMKIDGVEFPTVRFVKSNVTFERITGDIIIKDDSNTIDVNSGAIITITYTDSVGNSNSFTSSGSLTIPVDVNNLRSNETYSFAVSARVDLQDGNPAIDSCYVGSVIIKTEDPDPFKVEFNSIENTSAAFSINARLVGANNGDTELEADTLTGITFNLYSGSGTSGALVKSVKSVDKDLNAYSSELRTSYYDTSFRIDPNFFGVRNGDLTSEYYTIEITNAYDYTDHKNNLPIIDNLFTVKTEALIPDGPQDPNKAVDFYPVRNREMPSEKRRSDLDDSTIVGYKFRASYDNSKKYALSIHYNIHAMDGTVLDTLDYTIPASGEIEYSTIYVDDGLEPNVSDGGIHRGQTFYISYTIDLDTDYDGRSNLVYPLSGILKSENISPSRQDPIFNFYPSSGDNTKYSWKYTYSDIDHSLVNNRIYAYLDGVEFDSEDITQTDSYKVVTFDHLTPGIFSIYGKYLRVDGENTKQSLITSHYYEGVKTLDFGKIALYPDKNRVIFSFLDYESKPELFEKVSAVKIDFVTSDKTVTLDGLSLKTGNITVNYSLIESLIGKTINPKVTVYYDSGIYGFDNSGDSFAIQQLRSSSEEYVYYYTFANNKFTSSDTADGSYVNFNLNVRDNLLTINDKISGNSNAYPIFISSYGLAYNSSYISPKKLYNVVSTYSDVSSFKFNSIIPGLSILNESGESSISPLINTASVKFTMFGVDNKLKGDKVYVELFKSLDDTATNVVIVDTLEYNISDLNAPITFNNLLPETNYYFKVFGYTMENGEWTKTYLYDVDHQRDGVNYYFKTIGNIGISNLFVKYSASNYNSRHLYVTYDLAQTIGFTYIKYNVYKRTTDENGNLKYDLLKKVTCENDTFFKTKMTKYIDIPNTSGFVTGDTYVVEIQPVLVVNIDGVDTEVFLEKESVLYNFKTLYKPYFSIAQTSTSGSISYRVNVRDYNKTIVNGKYKIQILDDSGIDVTPDDYKGKKYSIFTSNKVFDFNDANLNKKYVFNILYDADFYNDSEKIQSFIYSIDSKTSTSNTISLGKVYADTDVNDPGKILLTFFDSVKLTDAKYIRYSIYDENSFSMDNEYTFVPTLLSTGDVSYYSFKLPEYISAKGVYYVSMQFLDEDSKILAEETVEFRYL